MRLKILFLLFFVSKCAHSANILGVFPFPGISHYILASKLMKGLAEAGHDVTVISPFELKSLPRNGKYTDIVLDGFVEDFQSTLGQLNMFEMELQSTWQKIKMMSTILLKSTNETLYHPKVKTLLKSNQKFDAVIMEPFNNDALKVFADIYDCPLILLSSVGPNAWINPMVGNPQPVSYVPHMLNLDFSTDFTIFYRAKNLIFYLIDYLVSNFIIQPQQNEIMHQAFPKAPPLNKLYNNVSLILLNSHTSMYSAVPVVPNMVEIGGLFIDPPQKLPKDLQDFLDAATDGVIYFSMGSNVKSKDIHQEKKNAIINVLGKLKQKVLWKFEEDLPGKPSNIKIKKWLPQQDILDKQITVISAAVGLITIQEYFARYTPSRRETERLGRDFWRSYWWPIFLPAHPNIKLFITHGGLLSTTETIYHGVPILALPVYGDQPANAERAAASGLGLKLAYNDPDFTEERFGFMLNEVLTNPKYRENAERQSKLFHDRPQKPMETAVYWVEYVIRHKGAPHLRVAGIGMPWYKYFMVDVLGALVLGLFIAWYSITLLFKKIFYKCKKSDKITKKIKTK